MITTLAMGTFSFLSTADTLVTLLIGILSFFGSSLMVLALQAEDVGTVQLIRKADPLFPAIPRFVRGNWGCNNSTISGHFMC